jgi:AhpD family alkylhydroperoxidase
MSEPTERNPIMTAKPDPFAAAPALMKSWMGTSMAVAANLDPTLMHLVQIRASQINGCANCINMHVSDARSKGETEQRVYLLSAWREVPCYTDRERVALGWTDALTRLSEGHERKSAYEALKAHFTDEEQVKLTLMIGSKLVRTGFINGLPGFITLEVDGEIQTTALDIKDGKIAAIYVVRNPDKLRHLH